jgi:hypothetical protein
VAANKLTPPAARLTAQVPFEQALDQIRDRRVLLKRVRAAAWCHGRASVLSALFGTRRHKHTHTHTHTHTHMPMWQGVAYVPRSAMVSIVVGRFRTQLSSSLAVRVYVCVEICLSVV